MKDPEVKRNIIQIICIENINSRKQSGTGVVNVCCCGFASVIRRVLKPKMLMELALVQFLKQNYEVRINRMIDSLYPYFRFVFKRNLLFSVKPGDISLCR